MIGGPGMFSLATLDLVAHNKILSILEVGEED